MTDQAFGAKPLPDRDSTFDSEASSASARSRAAGSPVSAADDRRADGHTRPAPQQGRMICICVDDFGQHADVNNAALRLAAMQRVHAIGCMVGGNAWKTWSRLLRRLGSDGIDLGLRLNLTDAPLLSRSRRAPRALIAASLTGRLDRRGLRAEIRAQLDTFEQAVGHAPAFFDGHQHVHELPGVRCLLLDELDERYGWFRPWVRSSRSLVGLRRMPGASGWRNAAQRLVQSMSSRGLATLARRRGYPQNRQLLVMQQVRDGLPRYREQWDARLRVCDTADLLSCRPTLGHDAGDPLVDARVAEFQWLSSPAFGELLLLFGVSLWPMSQILASQGTQA